MRFLNNKSIALTVVVVLLSLIAMPLAAQTGHNDLTKGRPQTVCIGPTINVSVTVSGAGGNNSGVLISLSGPTTASTTTLTNGLFSFNCLNTGSYTITYSKTGYVTQTQNNFIVTSGSYSTPLVTLLPVVTASSIGGTVTAAGTSPSAAISGATVTLFKGNVKTATAITAANGSYSFPNLAVSPYTVSITDSEYQAATLTFNITNANGQSPSGSVALLPTFTVTSSCSATPGNLTWNIKNSTNASINYSWAISNFASDSGTALAAPGNNVLTTANPAGNGGGGGPYALLLMIGGTRLAVGADTNPTCSSPGTASLSGTVISTTISPTTPALVHRLSKPTADACVVFVRKNTAAPEHSLRLSSGPVADTITPCGPPTFPVGGAVVTVTDNTNKVLGTATSDVNGNYSISSIPITGTNTYSITVSAPDYVAFKSALTLNLGVNTDNIQLVGYPVTYISVTVDRSCPQGLFSTNANSVQVVDAVSNQLVASGYTDGSGVFHLGGPVIVTSARPVGDVSIVSTSPIPVPLGHALKVYVNGDTGFGSIPAQTLYSSGSPNPVTVSIASAACLVP